MTDAEVWLDMHREYARFARGQQTAEVDFSSQGSDTELGPQKVKRYTELAEANSISSKLSMSSFHRPVLDIDIPVLLVPSTTPGHHHLYLDARMPWHRYAELLKTLGACEIIEDGYMRASLEREASWVRTPWTKKG